MWEEGGEFDIECGIGNRNEVKCILMGGHCG